MQLDTEGFLIFLYIYNQIPMKPELTQNNFNHATYMLSHSGKWTFSLREISSQILVDKFRFFWQRKSILSVSTFDILRKFFQENLYLLLVFVIDHYFPLICRSKADLKYLGGRGCRSNTCFENIHDSTLHTLHNIGCFLIKFLDHIYWDKF